jgi:hypothetical protein
MIKLKYCATKFLLSILFITLLAGCENKKTEIEIPENLIAKEKMIEILTEIQLAEAAISLSPLSHIDAVTRFKKYEGEIFAKHKVDSLTYFSSFRYYAAKGKTLQYLYLIVGDSIEKRRLRAEILARIDSTKMADSLKKIMIDSLAKVAEKEVKGKR